MYATAARFSPVGVNKRPETFEPFITTVYLPFDGDIVTHVEHVPACTSNTALHFSIFVNAPLDAETRTITSV